LIVVYKHEREGATREKKSRIPAETREMKDGKKARKIEKTHQGID